MNAQLWPLILFPFHISSKPSTLFGIAMRAWARRKTNKALATDKARRAGEIAEQARADLSFVYIMMKYCSWYVPEMPGKLARSMLESLLSLTKTGAQGLRPKAAAGTASSQQSNRSPARVPGQPKNCISRATMCLSSRCLRAIALTTWRRACQEHKGLCCSQCRSWQTWSQYQAALQAHLGT